MKDETLREIIGLVLAQNYKMPILNPRPANITRLAPSEQLVFDALMNDRIIEVDVSELIRSILTKLSKYENDPEFTRMGNTITRLLREKELLEKANTKMLNFITSCSYGYLDRYAAKDLASNIIKEL